MKLLQRAFNFHLQARYTYLNRCLFYKLNKNINNSFHYSYGCGSGCMDRPVFVCSCNSGNCITTEAVSGMTILQQNKSFNIFYVPFFFFDFVSMQWIMAVFMVAMPLKQNTNDMTWAYMEKVSHFMKTQPITLPSAYNTSIIDSLPHIQYLQGELSGELLIKCPIPSSLAFTPNRSFQVGLQTGKQMHGSKIVLTWHAGNQYSKPTMLERLGQEPRNLSIFLALLNRRNQA